MNIIVTGGAGFIGSHACRKLLELGHTIFCIDNFNDYYDISVKENNVKEFEDNENFKLFRIDILDYEKLREIFKNNDIDKIIHLAARAGVRPSLENPQLYADVNIKGTINLLELAKEFNIKNFVFASSSSIYGINKKVPFSEDDEVIQQVSPYGVSKRSAELYCYCYHKLYGLKISCLRLFTVYGPSGRPDMAPYLFTKLIDEGKEIERYGDGTTKRDYTFVTDIIDGILAAMDKDLDFEIINLGNSKPIELKYFISVIENALGKKANIKQLPDQPGDVPITYANTSKAERLLGYNPKVSIEEGMKRFVEWYKNV